MIQEFLDKIAQPFTNLWNKWMSVKAIPQSAMSDVRRAKMMKERAQREAKAAKDLAKKAGGMAKGAQGQVQAANAAGQAAAGQVAQAGQQAQGVVGQVQPQGGQENKKAKKKKMGLFGKKNVCPNCGQPQEKGWDKCPFCINVGAGGAPGGAAPAPGGFGAGAPGAYAPPAGGGGPQKTVAFMAGGTPGGPSMQLCGWVIPLKGAHKGELHNLKNQSVIGKDPTCDVVFNDAYMSSRHATIRAQNGVFILEDHSTNGTFVNDKKVKTHELVDNDFIKFGQTLVKFKQL